MTFFSSWPETHIPTVVMPRNGLPVTLKFTKQVLADVVGTAATSLLQSTKAKSFAENDNSYLDLPENTILVTENFKSKLVSSKDLGTHTSCRLGRIQQRMTIPLPDVVLQLRQMNRVNVLDIIIPHLEEVFDEIKRIENEESNINLKKEGNNIDNIDQNVTNGLQSVVIQGLITVEENILQDFIVVSWIGTPLADMVADCALGVIYQSLSANHYLRSYWNDIHIKSQQKESLQSSPHHHNHKHNHNHSHSHNCDDSDEADKRKLELNTQSEQIIKRMKLGLLDPSKSFKGLNENEQQLVQNNSLPENRLKLEKILNYLKTYSSSQSESISNILMSKDGLRLIIQGYPQNSNNTNLQLAPIEAYVYIHWSINRGHTLHHAVVQCLDDEFRNYIISLIQQMESSTEVHDDSNNYENSDGNSTNININSETIDS